MKEESILATFVLVSVMRRKSLKQADAASAIGLTSSAMSRACNYKRDLSFAEIVSFCDFAEINIVEFVGVYTSLASDKSRRMKVLAAVAALSAQSEYDNLLNTMQS